MKEICGIDKVTAPLMRLDREEGYWADKTVKNLLVFPGRSVVALNIGGGTRWKKKIWKNDRYFLLAEKLLAKKINVFLIYGTAESGLAGKLLESNSKLKAVETGEDLRKLFAVLNEIDVLVTGDTLALHAAAALGKRIVALFGPTSPQEAELYGRGEKIVSTVLCRVCYLKDCIKKPDCMEEIPVSKVFSAVLRQLKKR